MKQLIWTERWRPKTYEEVLGLNPTEMYEMEKNLPHLLFVGPAGIGKTTTMKIIANRIGSDVLLINASDERKLEVIREKIKSFAMTRKSGNEEGKVKIVMLDEFDGMLGLSQQALRSIMEKYATNCRFLLSANFENKIIDPIKSRCVRVTFDTVKEEDVLNRLKFICEKESLKLSNDLLKVIIQRMRGDIRKCINKLQELSNLKRTITSADIKKEEMFVEQIFARLKNKKIVEARQILLDNNVDYSILTLDCYYWAWNSDLEGNKKIKVIQHIADCSKYMNVVISKELLFLDFMIKIASVLQ